MKPAYVSVEYKCDGDKILTIEGWLTQTAMDVPIFTITPSLDFDDDVIKIALLWSQIVSIVPAQSIREYGVAGSWDETIKEHFTGKRIGWRVTHIPTGKTIERHIESASGIDVVNELASELLEGNPMGIIPSSDFKTEPIYAAE